MGRAHIVDPDTERPPEIGGLPVLDRRLTAEEPSDGLPVLSLPFDLRSRSRLRARLDTGQEVAVVLPRGSILRDGALLGGAGLRVCVRAAEEDVVEVRADSPLALLRVAYHLGNRHVPVQVLPQALVLGYDSVLVDMLVRMGVRLRRHWAPFEPEAGAYGDESGPAHGH